MLTLAGWSCYWKGMKLDLDTFCARLHGSHEPQQTPGVLSATYLFEKILMEIDQTFAGEEVLVICEQFSKYTWEGKNGATRKGQYIDIIKVLTSTLGTGPLMVKK